MAQSFPSITSPPESKTVQAGTITSFTVTATGQAPLAYRWYFNSAALTNSGRVSGATNATLQISNVMAGDAGNYFVTVTNSKGVATSAVAMLIVVFPPAINLQPLTQTVYVGEPFAFIAAATGTGPLTYRWQLNGTDLPGETGTNLSRAAAVAGDAGDYSLTASNAYGFAISSNATLAVLDSAPIIQGEPAGQAHFAGDDVALAVSALGSKPISYQWLHNGAPIGGATNAALTLPNVTHATAGIYQVVVTNRLGGVTTTGAVIKVQSVVTWGGVTSVPEDFTNVLAVVANEWHAALRADGTATNWEGGWFPPPDATNLVAVGVGGQFFTGVRADGKDFVWGNGCCAQLDMPPNLGKVVANASGQYHTIVIKADGMPLHFGDTQFGQAAIPAGLSNVVTAHSSDFQTLVAKADGTIAIWGSSPAGSFQPPADLSNVVAVATGWSHNLAVRRDRTLVMWGANQFGQCNIPAAISNNVVAVSAKGNGSLALLESGHAVWWGFNQNGAIPVPPGLSNVMSISLGWGYGHAIVGRQSPRYVQQPFSMTVPEGSSALLLGNALGTQPMTYQWKRQGTNLPGQTLPSLMMNNLLVADSAEFSLVVSNALGWTESAPATLAVKSVLVVTQPTNRVVVLNSNVTFVAAAAGTPPIGYRWRKDGVDLNDDPRISGTASGTLSIANVQTNDAGGYQLVATNSTAASTSAVATLTVIVPPTFIVSPTNKTVTAGTTAAFSVAVTGSEPLGFRWLFNGNAMSDDARFTGTTTPTLTISNVLTADAGNYTAIASNFAGLFTSSAATLTVIVPPAITTHPRSYSIPVGLPVTLTAAASGTAPLQYQWLLNGALVANATNASLVISNLAANQSGNYQLVASNFGGSATSAVGQVTFGPVASWGSFATVAVSPPWAPPGLSNVIAVAGGANYTLALRADGTLASWGLSNTPTNIPAGLSDAVAIVAGPNHALALRANGLVVAWGSNTSDQTNVPASLSNVVAVAAGTSHSVAVRRDGSLVVWGGSQFSGQTNIPAGSIDVIAVSAGGAQTLPLRQRGTVLPSWGTSDTGRVPPPPGELSDVVAIASGSLHHLALRTTGTIVTWGDPVYPVLTTMPVGLSNIIAIAASRGGNDLRLGLSLALRVNGTVIGWGTTSSVTNVPSGLSNVVAIALGDGHGLALVNDGRPLILRPPVGGTFNTGRDVTLRAKAAGNAPLRFQWFKDGNPVPAATNETLVLPSAQFSDAGNYHVVVTNTLGLAQSIVVPVNLVDGAPAFMSQPPSRYAYFGSPFSLGAAFIGSGPLDFQWLRNGQSFASGTNELFFDRALPLHAGAYQLIVSNAFGSATSSVAQITFTRVALWNPSLSDAPVDLGSVLGVAAGSFHMLAIRSNRTVAVWGTTQNEITNVPSTLSNVVNVSGGNAFSVALKDNGTVAAWGVGSSGQTSVPAGLGNVVAVSAGGGHALALRANGTVAAWGTSANGLTNVPAGLSNVVAVSAGLAHSLALKSDGSVVGWGSFGAIPTNLTAVAIAAGYGQSLALRADGTVARWTTGLTSPPPTAPPADLSNVVAIAAGGGNQGFSHNVALRADGTAVIWGDNFYGQLNVPPELQSIIQLSCGGSFTLALLSDRSPAFTVQPWDRQIVAGSNVTLTAFATGKPALQYQWRFNGQPLPGAQATSLTLSNILPGQAGQYALVAQNEFGAATSAVATVSVTIPQPLLKSFGAVSNGFIFTFQSVAGVIYVVEYKNDLNTVTWAELERRFGRGGLEVVTDPTAGGAMRLYRVRALYAPAPQLGAVTHSAGAMDFLLPTVAGANYIVQFKTNLSTSVWQELFRQTGTGETIAVNDPTTNGPSRFYRVKVE